eukprot:11400604-Prorocentrum_lima.AAC.1
MNRICGARTQSLQHTHRPPISEAGMLAGGIAIGARSGGAARARACWGSVRVTQVEDVVQETGEWA